jgi:hypothetical protein
MKKSNRKLKLETQTVTTLSTVPEKALAEVRGGTGRHVIYTAPLAGQ